MKNQPVIKAKGPYVRVTFEVECNQALLATVEELQSQIYPGALAHRRAPG